MHSIRSRLVVIGCLAAAAAACHRPWPADPGPGPADFDWRDAVGCYREDTWHFQLDSVPAESRFGIAARHAEARQVRSSSAWVPDRFWFVSDRNTIRVIIDDGLHGSVRELRLAGDTLIGRGWGLSDVVLGPPRPFPVRAVRTACDTLSLDPRRLEILLDSAAARFVSDSVVQDLDPKLPLFMQFGFRAYTSQDSVVIGNRVMIQRGLIWADTALVRMVVIERGDSTPDTARRRVYRGSYGRSAEGWLLTRSDRGEWEPFRGR